MRDGVLITPAPYSAPAAYYIPNVSRISSVEVLKGPSATAYGSHTVGGAVNLASLAVPMNDSEGLLDFSMGSDGFYKAQALYGARSGDYSYLLDVLTYGADGFKNIDMVDQDTGFVRNDVGLKLSYFAPESPFDHKVTLLLEAGDEDADETYLGLTDDDFRSMPSPSLCCLANGKVQITTLQCGTELQRGAQRIEYHELKALLEQV